MATPIAISVLDLRAATNAGSVPADPRRRDLAGICLLLGVLRALDAMPRDTLAGMLEALIAAEEGSNAG